MSEEQEVLNRELGGNNLKSCALCGIPRDKETLTLVSSEVIGHAGGGNVDVCVDCYKSLQRGDIDPETEPDF